MQVDLMSPFMQMAPTVAGVIICTALFIWNTIELKSATKPNPQIAQLIDELAAHRKLSEEMLKQNCRLLEEYGKDMAEMSEQISTLATNQLNLTHSVNEVVRELITIIREVER